MTIGHVALVILGILVAGGLMYGANRLVKYFDGRDSRSAEDD